MVATADAEQLHAWINGPKEEFFGQNQLPADDDFPFSAISPEFKSDAVGVVVRAHRFPDTWFKFVRAVVDASLSRVGEG